MKGDFEAAMKEFERAVDLDPQLAIAHFHLGWSLQQASRLDDAREAYSRAQKLDPRMKSPL